MTQPKTSEEIKRELILLGERKFKGTPIQLKIYYDELIEFQQKLWLPADEVILKEGKWN